MSADTKKVKKLQDKESGTTNFLFIFSFLITISLPHFVHYTSSDKKNDENTDDAGESNENTDDTDKSNESIEDEGKT